MMSRCYNANDKNYACIGAVGVSVAHEWHVFDGFLRDMGERPPEHRLVKDPESTVYGPGTCAWRPQFITRTHPSYGTWKAMRRRCGLIGAGTHRSPYYRDRGVFVCDRWADSFENFIADMGVPPSPSHSLDRIDTNGPYAPGNCRWATRQEQAENISSNQWVEYRGVRKTVSGWARELGITPAGMQVRLDMAFSAGKHLTKDRRVRQMTMDGHEVAVHTNVREAAKTGAASYAAIMKAISGANKSSGGFRWEYCDG